MKDDGSDLIRLTDGLGYHKSSRWSPGGTRVEVATGEMTRFIDSPENDAQAVWSSQSTLILTGQRSLITYRIAR